MRLYLLTILCFSIYSLPQQVNAALILHYDFNGDITDKSGNALNASITGSPSFVAGEFDQAIYINNPAGQVNATEYISLPNHATLQSLEMSSFTWAIKYKTDDAPHTNGRIFGNTNSSATGGFGGVYDDHLRDNSYAFVIGTNEARHADPESESQPNALTTDGEYHWAFITVDRVEKTFNYYVDEHLIVSKLFTDLGSVSFDNISVGRITSLPTFSARLTTVDEVLIYDMALDQAQVAQVNDHNFALVSEPNMLVLMMLAIFTLAIKLSLQASSKLNLIRS
ncbi:LamG-like jellyroll fold domain-containing protein [Thalassomonas sp. RHCl1]|uniref:LamG-like jellyroll fold domain-containing protein n=1 Tax=Thalassomonas sp. RHCl1 TaxID=2995320 RepID=UPI00248B5596|nr:LamG-like jellyroll fold domain-containing protein [Thalassomonas sp. RHCl1]